MSLLFDINAEPGEAAFQPLRKLDEFSPRPYQAETVENAKAGWADSEDGLAVLFTGAGKTYVAALMADLWLRNYGDNVLLVAPSDQQLTWQLHSEMRDFFGVGEVSLDMGSFGRPNHQSPDAARIVVACRATIGAGISGHKKDKQADPGRRLKLYDQNRKWLVIFDEAHNLKPSHSQAARIFGHFNNQSHEGTRFVGLTATPRRLDKVSLGNLFPRVIQDMPLRRAIDEGYSVPCEQKFVMVEGVDFRELKTIGKDFDSENLAEVLSRREVLMSIVKPIIDLSEDRQTLVYCNTVAEAKLIAHTINAEKGGTFAASINGNTEQHRRDEVISSHKQGQLQYVCVCNMLMEGYDDKEIRCVALVKRTKSKARVEQMIGRGSRVLANTIEGVATPEDRRQAIADSAKPSFRVIDLIGTDGVHGPSVSATEVLADGLDEELLRNVLDKTAGGQGDVEQAIEDAIREAEEQERKRREAEEKAKAAKLAQEEEDRRMAEQARREARIKAEVRYRERTVGSLDSAGSTSSRGTQKQQEPPSAKQLDVLRKWGIGIAGRSFSKQQATQLIGVLFREKPGRHAANAIADRIVGERQVNGKTALAKQTTATPQSRPTEGVQGMLLKACEAKGVRIPPAATASELARILRELV